MTLYLEKREIKCQCGAKFKYFWDGQYWCESCGTTASLIKLIRLLQSEVRNVQDLCDKLYLSFNDLKREIAGQLTELQRLKTKGGNTQLLSKPN